jgi:hypothetical protein
MTIWLAPAARAAAPTAVVGSGTPASCTEAELAAALVLGGTISFRSRRCRQHKRQRERLGAAGGARWWRSCDACICRWRGAKQPYRTPFSCAAHQTAA